VTFLILIGVFGRAKATKSKGRSILRGGSLALAELFKLGGNLAGIELGRGQNIALLVFHPVFPNKA
jgi:hypothetical protein